MAVVRGEGGSPGLSQPVFSQEVVDPCELPLVVGNEGVGDTHVATWEWGDGAITPGELSAVDGLGSVTGSHVYETPGVYAITLTIVDDDGGESIPACFQYVVAYDPGGGFVTGGGWIDSPPGAYVPNPGLIGKAKFGFNSKYKKGADVPAGQTQFGFKVADLDFHSTTYQWLIVAGPKATCKGEGTVNGAGTYGFMLTAVDGALTPSTDVDHFRIKIWDRDNGDAVVYDNALDAADSQVKKILLMK